MDKFIKSVPLITIVCLLAFVLQSGDAEYSNAVAASLCAIIVFMLMALVYTVMAWFKMSLMPAGYYVVVMFGAGILTFAFLYASLEYFYT